MSGPKVLSEMSDIDETLGSIATFKLVASVKMGNSIQPVLPRQDTRPTFLKYFTTVAA
jgi:hypothetical protein